MSQHDFNIANQTFPSFRADLNDALQASATMSAGSSAPTTPYAYQLWFDTTDGSWKVRNSGNTAWISTITTDLATGNVGIGTSSVAAKLDIRGMTGTTTEAFLIGYGANGDNYYTSGSSGSQIFRAANTERMRIDSNGQLIVGHTGAGSPYFNEGIVLNPAGDSVFHRDGNSVVDFSRETSDGNIVRFVKDNTVVGSIGVEGFDLAIGNGDAGIQFVDGNEHFRPFNVTTNAATDALMNIGSSTKRFKDLYLSGGVVFGTTGGTVTSKTLDDYEEGTFTPTIRLNSAGTTVTYSAQVGFYTKVGNIVHALVQIANSSHNSTTSGALWRIGGLPFTNDSTDAGGYFAYNNNSGNIWGAGRANNGTTYILIYGSYPSSASTHMTITYRTNS